MADGGVSEWHVSYYYSVELWSTTLDNFAMPCDPWLTMDRYPFDLTPTNGSGDFDR